MNILLTGGLGYIGSHTAVTLCSTGHRVVLLDNLTNCHKRTLDGIGKIIGYKPPLEVCDVRNTDLVKKILQAHKIDAVIHFAGLKSVEESFKKPLSYLDNNIAGSISLLKAMQSEGIRKLVFSSSATVYGQPQYLPLDEAHPTGTTSPYARTKLYVENILEDLATSDPKWRIATLRYFNPAGAHESGLIGESPIGAPNNLIPYITRVASGTFSHIDVWGNDYPTPDGTGIRDYIHVMDLAAGHKAALDHLDTKMSSIETYNLGTGRGHSVLELIEIFSNISGRQIPYKIANRREGDVAISYAATHKANNFLEWHAQRDLQEICQSAWRFQCTQN